jgi:hypothetical protein
MTKLIVTDLGDLSVGIFVCSWSIEIPIYIPDTKNISESEKEDLEFFRSKMIETYKEFANGRIVAEFDFEIMEQAEYLLKD